MVYHKLEEEAGVFFSWGMGRPDIPMEKSVGWVRLTLTPYEE